MYKHTISQLCHLLVFLLIVFDSLVMEENMTKETLGGPKCHCRNPHNQSLLQVTVMPTFLNTSILLTVVYGK